MQQKLAINTKTVNETTSSIVLLWKLASILLRYVVYTFGPY